MRAECLNCHIDFAGSDELSLAQKMYKHHVGSKMEAIDPFTRGQMIIHQCGSFRVFDDDGVLIGCDTFAHDRNWVRMRNEDEYPLPQDIKKLTS